MSNAVSIALKGRQTIAQGKAQGSRANNFISPERAKLWARKNGRALSGLGIFWTPYPGLRPGLTNDGLSGLFPRVVMFVLLAVFACCTGCTTVREFHGATTNLKGDGTRTPPGTHAKISIACSGATANGGRYVVYSFRHQNCFLVVCHPPSEPPGSLMTRTDLGQTSAWVVRGSKPDCVMLAKTGKDADFSAGRAERMRGSVEILWISTSDFVMPVKLAGETGDTALEGECVGYTAFWKPLLLPAMLFGFGGAEITAGK